MHWNARSLIANGQEFKHYVVDRQRLPDIICVQETWLKPHLSFTLCGYTVLRWDRIEGNGGGVATFLKDGLVFRALPVLGTHESVEVEVWGPCGKFKLINYYNPCKKLTLDTLSDVGGLEQHGVVWCGGFNAHNTLWGGSGTDQNGTVLEQFLFERDLVCLNDGRGTRLNVARKTTTVLDLTFASSILAGMSSWDLCQSTSLGVWY